MRFYEKLLICSFLLIFVSVLYPIYYNNFNFMKNVEEKPRQSGFWATLDLYDPMGLNNTRIPTNNVIDIQGRLYNLFDGIGKQGYTVIIYLDGTPYSSFNDVTDGGGNFNIAYTVNPLLDLFSSHTLEVIVESPAPPGNVDYTSHFNIDVSTSSYFELNDPDSPKMLGENLEFEGYLRYENGNGIPLVSLNYGWYSGSIFLTQGNVFTNNQGEINDIYIPDWAGDSLTLKLNYSNNPYVGFSQGSIINTKLFSSISCEWNLPDSIVENRQFRIQGQILSSNDPNLHISSRNIRILYNFSVIANVITNNDGFFDYTYQLLNGTGVVPLEIEMDGPIGSISTGNKFVEIKVAPPPTPPSNPPDFPFLDFFIIFIPVLISIIVALAGYGFYRYKKNEKESRVVHLPLEDRILNLKILKDSGRLEESLSYLFNAIYMDLINAKYGRTRKNTETIRDFAIISVTQLNLTPTSIYPFIQKVEEIIYAKPFQITDKEFYKTIELFSPIYHELTGYNFVVNF